MNTNWYGMTTAEHFKRFLWFWFVMPFTKEFWVCLFEEHERTMRYAGYIVFSIFFMLIGFGFLWITSPISLPLTAIIARMILVRKSRQLVIDALTSK
jgi:hypothetical protein